MSAEQIIDNREETKVIADTIIDHLGSRRFMMMTGACHFTYDSTRPGFLSFKVPSRYSKYNHVEVQLNGNDLYDVCFFNVSVRKFQLNKKLGETHTDIHCEDLRGVFERATGLWTSL